MWCAVLAPIGSSSTVHEELVDVMGGANEPWPRPAIPTVVLMAGLQGAGKTAATAKLGLHLEQGAALLVAADTYRPAAIDRQTLGKQIDVEVFSLGADAEAEAIAEAGLAKGKEDTTVIVDTAALAD